MQNYKYLFPINIHFLLYIITFYHPGNDDDDDESDETESDTSSTDETDISADGNSVSLSGKYLRVSIEFL